MSDTTVNQTEPNGTPEPDDKKVSILGEPAPEPKDGDDSDKGDKAGDADKGKDGEAQKPDVPESYDLKAPEGMSIDVEALKQFTPIAKELGLSNDQAQKLADFYAQRQASFFEEQRAGYAKTVEGWIQEVKSDKEIGGVHLEATQVSCRKALQSYDPDGEFRKLMDDSGFGNHPAVLRFVNRVGKSVKEDQGIKGKPATPKERDISQILYTETKR